MQLVELFSEPSKFNVILHKRNQPRSTPCESLAFLPKLFSVDRPELSPGRRVNETGRPELLRTQHLFDKNTDRSGKRVQRVVQSDNSTRLHMRSKTIKVILRALISMVAIDPQEVDRLVPGKTHILRKRMMKFHVLCHTGRLQRLQEIVMRRSRPGW